MLLQNPNWAGDLNKLKRRIRKIARANIHDYTIDLTKKQSKSADKQAVTDVATKLILALSDLNATIDTTKMYRNDSDERSIYLKKMMPTIDPKMTAVLLLLQHDVKTTYLYWPKPTFIRVAELFNTITRYMTIIFEDLIARGIPDPNRFFPQWGDLYSELSMILNSYQNEGGKQLGDSSQILAPSANIVFYQAPPKLKPVKIKQETPGDDDDGTATPTPGGAASNPVTPQSLTTALTSSVMSPKVQAVVNAVKNSPKVLRGQRVTQNQVDELEALVSHILQEIADEEGVLQQIENILAEPEWKRHAKTRISKRDPNVDASSKDLQQRRKDTKKEITDLTSQLKIAQKNLEGARNALENQTAAQGNFKPGSLQPKARRASRRISFTPFGGTPTTPQSGSTPSATKIAEWRVEEERLIEEIGQLTEQKAQLTSPDDDAEIQDIDRSLTRMESRLITIETDLTDAGEQPMRGRGRPHRFASSPQSTRPGLKLFYNIDPPQYVQPYGVLLPVSIMPRRYL